MNLKSILVFLFFGCCLTSQAQTINVKSFEALPMDMNASSIEGKRLDQNGEVAALIRVVTTEQGFAFEGGTLGIVDTKQKVGEIWVWVPRGARKISIMHQKLGVLRDYRYPIEIESGRTYEMVLTTAKIENIIIEEVRQQYLTFQITPSNATLEVNDKLWSLDVDGIATQYVKFGSYTYRVRAADYFTEAGVVTIDDPNNTKVIVINLKPNFTEVTLAVDADAEIWVNDEKKGVRKWTGSLGNGTYKIECKQAGHETSMVSKEINEEMNGQTITLPAPRPIYGSVNVESNPNLATLYVDGKEMGKTPKSINEILVGSHEIKLSKDGYVDHKETITIKKGERQQVKVTLNKDGSTPPPSKPRQPQPQQQVTKQKNSVFFVMANAAYSVAPQTSFGLTIGSAKRFGWYASFGTNFNFSNATDFECDGDGQIYSNISQGEYYFYGIQKTSRLSATAGLTIRFSDPVYTYLGVGYGYRNLFWSFYDNNSYNNWAKNLGYSYQGLSLDAGLMLHFNGFGISAGVQTIGIDYLETKIGIGYTLKK